MFFGGGGSPFGGGGFDFEDMGGMGGGHGHRGGFPGGFTFRMG